MFFPLPELPAQSPPRSGALGDRLCRLCQKPALVCCIRLNVFRPFEMVLSWRFRSSFEGSFYTIYTEAWLFYSTISLCFLTISLFYSTIFNISVALDSSGSISASATPIIFLSQTFIFYSLGTHLAIFAFYLWDPHSQNIFKDCC